MDQSVTGNRGMDADDSRRRPAAEPPVRRTQTFNPFYVYKSGQGAYVRWGTTAGLAILVLGLAALLYDQIGRITEDVWVRTLTPVVAMVALGYLAFWLVAQHRPFVDFMIATEGEMKKVNWPSRREVFGATRVVIVVVLGLSLILFLVDLLFIIFFRLIGVLRIDVLGPLFGGGDS